MTAQRVVPQDAVDNGCRILAAGDYGRHEQDLFLRRGYRSGARDGAVAGGRVVAWAKDVDLGVDVEGAARRHGAGDLVLLRLDPKHGYIGWDRRDVGRGLFILDGLYLCDALPASPEIAVEAQPRWVADVLTQRNFNIA